jgi:hypothetical protein
MKKEINTVDKVDKMGKEIKEILKKNSANTLETLTVMHLIIQDVYSYILDYNKINKPETSVHDNIIALEEMHDKAKEVMFFAIREKYNDKKDEDDEKYYTQAEYI